MSTAKRKLARPAVLASAENHIGRWEVRPHREYTRDADGELTLAVVAEKVDLYFVQRSADGKRWLKASFVEGAIPRELFNLEAQS